MSDKVNPNVETGPVEGPSVNKGPGESVSFDQMEALMDQGERAPQVDKQSGEPKNEHKFEEIERITAEDETTEQGEPSQVAESDGGAEKEAQVEEKAQASEEEQETQQEEVVDTQEKPAKIYKVKNGDSEVDLRADTEIEVTVKGEPVKVTLQDMMNDYSGGTNWNKKFSELDKERKSFESDRALLHDTAGAMHTALTENKDWREAFTVLAESFDLPPFEFIHMAEDQMVESLKNSDGFELSDEDRQLKRRADEAEYWQKRYERDQQRSRTRAEQKKARGELDEAASKYGMTDEQGAVDNKLIVESFDALVNGGIEKSAITAEMIGQYHFAKIRSEKISGVLKEVAPELGGEEFTDALTMLTTELSSLEISDDKAEELVREVYGKSNTKVISDKIKKGQEVRMESPNKPKSPANDPMFFEDIT